MFTEADGTVHNEHVLWNFIEPDQYGMYNIVVFDGEVKVLSFEEKVHDVVFDATPEEKKAYSKFTFDQRKGKPGTCAYVGDVLEIISGTRKGKKFILRMSMKEGRQKMVLGFNGHDFYKVPAASTKIIDIKLDYSKETKYMEV